MSNPSGEDTIGSKSAIKSLYNHSADTRPRHTKWSEFKDLISEEQRLKELGQPYAIVHRFSRYEGGEGEYAWKTLSIEIQSTRLRAILDKIFFDYPDWNSDGSPYTFSPPFKPFIHRWDKILESFKQEKDKSTKKEIELLHQALEPLLSSHLFALKQAKSTGVISFNKLWLILAPGDLMLSCENGNICVSRLKRVKFVNDEPSHWKVTLDQSDWNGSYCGIASTSSKIYEFAEPMLAIRLNVHPLEFAPNQKDIQDILLARGKKFASLRGFHIMTCIGKKYRIENDEMGRPREKAKPVSGRIIVDAYAFYKCQEMVPPALVRSIEAEPVAKMDPEPSKMQLNENNPRKNERKEELRALTDIECILAVPRVKGFDLKAKEWWEFNVDDIYEPDWNDAPYDNLVLPAGEKELITAFADRPQLDQTGFDDFVQHKGEGIIILLCGPPGVGKTLTAEAVAEESRVPLYMLSAGDLGTTPETVESALNNALECCQLWDAVLLLDEADVFLESRDSNSLERNELVSIFLRRLEYYQGLMFLTTNRINAIDPAFKSRIDLILPYHDLDETARRRVWVNFFSLLSPTVAKLYDDDFDELAKSKMNGREIKNSIKTALVLAARDKPLRMKHLKVVLTIRERVADFDLDDHHPRKRRTLENQE